MSKLYATATSEKASKGQGGNKYIDVAITDINRTVLFTIQILAVDDRYSIASVGGQDYLRKEVKALLSLEDVLQETKGNKQKGDDDCICKELQKEVCNDCECTCH